MLRFWYMGKSLFTFFAPLPYAYNFSKLIKYNLWILKERNNFSYLWKFSFGAIFHKKPKNLQRFAQSKRIQVSGIREKSRIQENLPCGIRNIAQEIRNPTHDWTPESKFHWQRLESSTWNPESTTFLDPVAWGVLCYWLQRADAQATSCLN